MRSDKREKILVELREYHTKPLPDSLSTKKMEEYRVEFEILQDQVISMLLGLVNQKSEYVDFSEELSDFKDKVSITHTGDRKEDENRQSFLAKIKDLLSILNAAKAANFIVKAPRYSKA